MRFYRFQAFRPGLRFVLALLLLAELQCSAEYDVLLTEPVSAPAGSGGATSNGAEGGSTSVGNGGESDGVGGSSALPVTECFSDSDCVFGEICYPGAECRADCASPDCCLGNQCSRPGCSPAAELGCALVGCTAGRICVSSCLPPTCECDGELWFCVERENGSGGTSGENVAGASGSGFNSGTAGGASRQCSAECISP